MKKKDILRVIFIGMIFLFIFGILGLAYLLQTEYEVNQVAPGFGRAFHKFLCCLILGSIFLAVSFYIAGREKCSSLSRENKKYMEMIKASADLVFYCSSKSKKIDWYGRARQIAALAEESSNFEKISHPEDFPVILQQFEDSRRGKVYDVQTRIMGDAGSYETFSCRMVPVKNAEESHGNVVGFIKKLNPPDSD